MTSTPAPDVPASAAALKLIAVAINPQASFGKHRGVGPAVVSALEAVGHRVLVIAQPNYELLRRETGRVVEQEALDALVVVGGDGMVSLGVNLVAETDVALGIVATGTGNDMARTLGLPIDDPDAGIARLKDALCREPRRIDLGRVRHGELSTWFGCVLSAGFDAVVNERANRMTRPRGSSRYTLSMVRELLTFRPIAYRLEVDGVTSDRSAMLVSVANGRSIGAGMMITPDAQLDDGMLDLFVVEAMSRLKLLRVFPRVFKGTHTSLPEVSIVRARSVKLQAEGAIAYADGERVGPLPVEVTVVPRAMSVLV
ncbi:MAG: diacylglycerol/lipid kinase family protein [Humibacter sp.]